MNSGPTLSIGSTGPDVRRLQVLFVMMKEMNFSDIDGKRNKILVTPRVDDIDEAAEQLNSRRARRFKIVVTRAVRKARLRASYESVKIGAAMTPSIHPAR